MALAVNQRCNFDLATLVSPIGLDEFFRDYWEQRPLIVRRDLPDYFSGLLTFADVDHILATSPLGSSDLRVVHAGKHLPVQSLRDGGLPGSSPPIENVYREYRRGATLVFQALHERCESLGRITQSLASDLSASVQVNVYLTPRGEIGLPLHYDTHDVFVVQSHGSKYWTLYDRIIDLPLKSQPYARESDEQRQPSCEFLLEAGDSLYLPRGFLHRVEARDSDSLHLTIGIHPVTWASILRRNLEVAIEQDSRLREALPPGFVDDAEIRSNAVKHLGEISRTVFGMIDPEQAINEAADVAWTARRPALDGHLLDLSKVSSLELETPVRVRADLSWQIDQRPSETILRFHGKEVCLPGIATPCIDFMTGVKIFRAAELPGELDSDSRLVLVRRLVREGFLTLDMD